MNNQIPMRKFYRSADLQKQLQSLPRRQLLRNCKASHRCIDNIVHDEVGETIVGRACIEQARDIRMIELARSGVLHESGAGFQAYRHLDLVS